jgi:hypothetical protein
MNITPKKIGWFILMLVVLGISRQAGREIGHIAYEKVTTSNDREMKLAFSEGLARGAKELKGKLPMKLDDATTFVRAEADGLNMTYWYKLSDDKYDVDKEKLRSYVTNNICSNDASKKNMRIAYKMGHTKTYIYSDRSGRFVTAFDVTSSSCNI